MLVEVNKFNQRVEIKEYASKHMILRSSRPNRSPYFSWPETVGISSCCVSPSAIKHFYDIYFLITVLTVLFIHLWGIGGLKILLSLQYFLPQGPSQLRLPVPKAGFHCSPDCLTPHFLKCLPASSVSPTSISNFLSWHSRPLCTLSLSLSPPLFSLGLTP